MIHSESHESSVLPTTSVAGQQAPNRVWVKPTLDRLCLKSALTGSGHSSDATSIGGAAS
jgi:hypothetical protein